ncbi:MAG: D-aminoacyl-tRNA deacylase, partial [Candidatus Thorarchaeota archaeon]
SAAFKPALLTHIPGNWATAELGGKPPTLCKASPSALKIALQKLLAERQRLGLMDWACGLEATHHGPFIQATPVLYVEIGSTETEWQNITAAEVVARTIVTIAQRFQESYPAILGFGGPHYCPAFTQLCSETQYAVGHVMPKYHLDQISEHLVQHALEQTSGPLACAALDWKGMTSRNRKQVIQILEKLGIEVKRVRSLLRDSAEK